MTNVRAVFKKCKALVILRERSDHSTLNAEERP
jgi:hypothetical protein